MEYINRMNQDKLQKISEIPVNVKGLRKNFPNFKRPKICGYFSLNKNREYVPNLSQLKYLYNPNLDKKQVNYDLNNGIEKTIRKPEDLNEGIIHLLYFILDNYRILRNPNDKTKLLQTDFVCFRGLLTHMMESIYHDETWTILVTNWKGTLYLSEIKNKPNYEMPKEKMNMFCSWGFKMEQYLLTSKYGEPPDTNQPVNESEEFCAVFQTKLNNKNLLYGAEMDGIISSSELSDPVDSWNDVEFIEIKTNRQIFNYEQDYKFRKHKFLKWWAQSFLVGIEKLFCGFRNDDGVVEDVQQFAVKDLPKNACQWDACVAMNLCDRFLNVIKDTIPSSNDPNITWRVEWKSKGGNYCIETWSTLHEVSILPNWYTESLLKLLIQ